MARRYDTLLVGAHLATLDGEPGFGAIEDGAVAWKDGVLAYVGPRAGLPGLRGGLNSALGRNHGRFVLLHERVGLLIPLAARVVGP